MSKSIIQHEKVCFLCGSRVGLEEHHIFGGANRKNSEKYGLKIWLCGTKCHRGNEGVHLNRATGDSVKRLAQIAFEAKHSHDEWMQVFRKNYL